MGFHRQSVIFRLALPAALLSAPALAAAATCSIGSSDLQATYFINRDVVLKNDGSSNLQGASVVLTYNHPVKPTKIWGTAASFSSPTVNQIALKPRADIAPGGSAIMSVRGDNAGATSVSCTVVGASSSPAPAPAPTPSPSPAPSPAPAPAPAPTPTADACKLSNSTYLFSQTFDSFKAGAYALTDERAFKNSFCLPLRYVSGFGNKANECDPGKDCDDERKREAAGQFNGASTQVRVAVDNTTAAYSGNALKVLYPKGTNTSSHSGAQFEMAIPGAVAYDRATTSYKGTAKNELFLQYRVKFDPNFDFAQGGKLPGFLASFGANTPDGLNEVSARIMWRAAGRLEFYLHTEFDPRERLFWNNVPGQGHAAVTKNKWHTIQMRMKLNTPGLADGIWQGWLDGVLVGDYRDLKFRNDAKTNINTVFFSTFHGGSSGDASSPEEIWWPSRDGTAWFDSFDVSSSQIR